MGGVNMYIIPSLYLLVCFILLLHANLRMDLGLLSLIFFPFHFLILQLFPTFAASPHTEEADI